MNACAALALTIHFASIHSSPGYNNVNPGAGLVCERGSYSIAVGGYRNSVMRTSVYAVASKEWGSRFKIGAVGGIATGYDYPISPMGGLSFGVDALGARFRVLAVPKLREKDAAVLHFMVTTPIGG